MIEQYWNEMFGEFKFGARQFHLPGFPEPLMSPDFAHRNIIGDRPPCARNSFLLCGFPPASSEVKIKVRRLEEVITDSGFWDYQQKFVPETVNFMKRLLPFLINHKKPHYFFSVMEGGSTIATAFGGEGDSKCLLFNLKVRTEFQNMGMASRLLAGARGHFSKKETFYWTVHPKFTMGAPYVKGYHLL